jgi:hypothetical protein
MRTAAEQQPWRVQRPRRGKAPSGSSGGGGGSAGRRRRRRAAGASAPGPRRRRRRVQRRGAREPGARTCSLRRSRGEGGRRAETKSEKLRTRMEEGGGVEPNEAGVRSPRPLLSPGHTEIDIQGPLKLHGPAQVKAIVFRRYPFRRT